jgi:signal transduction histidine kinase
MIEDAGITMLNMINRTFDLYRLAAGTYTLAPVPVNRAAVVRKAARDVTADAFFAGRTVRVLCRGHPADEGDCLTVSGEELLCYSMFSNLLRNAVESSPEGGEVTVSLGEEGGEAVVAVTNAGEVPEDVRARFFEKYVTAGKRDGTGLGTYSALLAARAHGGRAELDTESPGFTTVRVFLPLAGEAAGS